MLSNQVSKMLHLELLYVVTLQAFFGAGFYLFDKHLSYLLELPAEHNINSVF